MRKSSASRYSLAFLAGACLWITGTTLPGPDSILSPLSTAELRVSADRWIFDVALAQWTPVMRPGGPGYPVTQREQADGREFALSTAAGWQIAPVVAWNNVQDEFLAVWEDFRNGSDRDIYAQRFDADGRLIGDNQAVVIGQYDQTDPVLLHDKVSGGYALIWHHQQRTNDGVYWQRLSATGAPLGMPKRVPSPLGRQQWIPGAALNEARRELLVVWEDLSTSEILGQRIAYDNGEALGDPIVVSDRPKLQWTPTLATFSPALEEYLVVWDDLLRGDLFGQVVTADGQLRGDDLAISVAAGKQFISDLVYNDAQDEYLAVWTDQRSPSADDSDVYCQRIAGGGLLLGNEQVVSGAPGLQQDCVGWHDHIHGEYTLVWWDSRDMRNGNDIHAQRVSANGALLGPDAVVSSNSADQVYPALAYAEASDRYAVVWQEWRVLNERDVEADVRAMIYSPLRFSLRFPWITQGWQDSQGVQ